jgi:hypothetical protein
MAFSAAGAVRLARGIGRGCNRAVRFELRASSFARRVGKLWILWVAEALWLLPCY